MNTEEACPRCASPQMTPHGTCALCGAEVELARREPHTMFRYRLQATLGPLMDVTPEATKHWVDVHEVLLDHVVRLHGVLGRGEDELVRQARQAFGRRFPPPWRDEATAEPARPRYGAGVLQDGRMLVFDGDDLVSRLLTRMADWEEKTSSWDHSQVVVFEAHDGWVEDLPWSDASFEAFATCAPKRPQVLATIDWASGDPAKDDDDWVRLRVVQRDGSPPLRRYLRASSDAMLFHDPELQEEAVVDVRFPTGLIRRGMPLFKKAPWAHLFVVADVNGLPVHVPLEDLEVPKRWADSENPDLESMVLP